MPSGMSETIGFDYPKIIEIEEITCLKFAIYTAYSDIFKTEIKLQSCNVN